MGISNGITLYIARYAYLFHFYQQKFYNLISEIYSVLENYELSKKVGDPKLRTEAINSLKSELIGISQKGYEI